MILVGIDDTDIVGSRGTNQLARALARQIATRFACQRITRHQLLNDPRVPCTSKNGSASLVLSPLGDESLDELFDDLADAIRADFIAGSDPGLCVASAVPPAVHEFGRRCQRELLGQSDAHRVAAECGIRLAGLGGTQDGMIGALAAVGLAAGDDDGRVVQWGPWPDDLSGVQTRGAVERRGIAILDVQSGEPVDGPWLDVGKKLRPNWRAGRCVLFVRRSDPQRDVLHAVKLP